MPISATSADAVYGAPARAGGLLLDYGGRDRGPFRAALLQAAAGDAAPAIPDPAGMPAAAAVPPAPVFEGADALAALGRDLAGGGVAAPLQTAAVPAPGDVAPAVPADVAAAGDDETPGLTESWRNDEIKGRRLGDRPAPDSGETGTETWLFGKDGFGFDDLLDIVNPLQHIPVVSSLYRWITGDEIGPAASIAGGALFGGPLGAAGAVAGVAVAEATGRDLGEHAIAMMFGDDAGGEIPPASDLAGAPPADQPPSATPSAFLPLPANVPAPAPQMAGLAPALQPPRVFGGGIPSAGLPAIGGPAVFIPAAPPGGADAAAADGAIGSPGGSPGGSPADAAIATQMMDALNKYEALVRARVGTAPSIEPAAGSLYDSHM